MAYNPEEPLTLPQAAAQYGVSRRTLQSAVQRGRLPYLERSTKKELRTSGGGPTYLISRGALHAYLRSRKPGHTVPVPERLLRSFEHAP